MENLNDKCGFLGKNKLSKIIALEMEILKKPISIEEIGRFTKELPQRKTLDLKIFSELTKT